MYFTTEIKAIDPTDGVLKTYSGPYIPALSIEDAEKYCQDNGLGYCEVTGKLVMTIPANGYEADMTRSIDYDKVGMN